MILDVLAQSARKRVENAKDKVPFEELKSHVIEQVKSKRFNRRADFAFEKALRNEGVSFICEVKRASPSKGMIAPSFPYLEIAAQYEKAGAHAISVLTEPEYFKGSDIYLKEISESVSVPVLRKDFIIDEYQIYESKLIGADAVLLIVSLLDTDTLRRFIKICDGLGLSALVEAHTKEEVESAVNAGARIIGVNNRDLRTFEVDINNCVNLRGTVPQDVIYVAESGIKTLADILLLEKAGVDAVLIGEALMKCKDRKTMLSYLMGRIK